MLIILSSMFQMRALQVGPTCLTSLSGLSLLGLSTTASVSAAQGAGRHRGEAERKSSALQRTLSRSADCSGSKLSQGKESVDHVLGRAVGQQVGNWQPAHRWYFEGHCL